MGGFNPSMGMGGFDEHLDENAMQAAAKQKTLSQQSSTSVGTSAAPSATNTAGSANPLPQTQVPPPPPREVGTLTEELLKRPAQDIYRGLAQFFDLNTLLGIDPKADDPQTQARKKQIHQRWNKLTEEQQAVARQKYQEEMQKKQREEQEKQQRKQAEEQQKNQQFQVPSGPQKGPVGPGGSGKQRAVQKLQQDRKTLNGPGSSN